MAPQTLPELAARVRRLGNQHARHGGAVDRAVALARLPLDRALLGRQGRFEQLRKLGDEAATSTAAGAAAGAPRVLVLALRGWISHSAYEFTIAQALRLRGAEVALLTCGGGQPACEMGWARNMFPRPCDRCAWFTDTFAGAARLPTYRLVDQIPWGRNPGGAPARPENGAGDFYGAAAISVPWFLRTTRPERVPEGRQATEDFAVAAEAVEGAATRVLDEFAPDIVFMVNGLFAAEQVIRRLALHRGLRAPTYEMAPRADALVFSQHAPAPDYDTSAIWARTRDRPLTPEQDAEVAALLGDRARGVGAHERYFDDAEEDREELRRRLSIPAGARVISLFTNLSWDSATIGHDAGYTSMFDWIERTVRSAAVIDDLVLVIRIHPAEARWGTREEVEAEVVAAVGGVPGNVRFVPATQALSSYALVEMSELVLTYTTTVGLEAAFRGVPVAVAGDTHYRNRGFTLDVEHHEQLEDAMRTADGRMDPALVELARRYAYTFFFRSMIPFPAIHAEGALTHEIPSSIEQLTRGRDPFLDWICDRILDGREFTLPDELAGLAPHG